MMIRSLGASEPIALADSYAIDLHTGHKIAVRYSVAVDAKDRRGIADSYNESEQWVHRVRDRLRDDFGPAVEELWALGTHGYRNIGESARLDHQTRVFKLADLIEQMRRGYLVKR